MLTRRNPPQPPTPVLLRSYIAGGMSVVLLGLGLSARPTTDINVWAKEEALRRRSEK